MSETPAQPPVPPSAPPAAPARRNPTGWTVVGIVLLVLSLFSFPRGLILLIAEIARGGNVAYAFGGFMFGAALVTVGIVLLVQGAKIRKANRALDAQAAG